MTPNDGLILPNIVPVESKLILPPGEREAIEAEREAMLAAIEAEEAERGDDDDEDDVPLSARCRKAICHDCGHLKLVFLPAKLCEKCLHKAADAAGLPFPKPGGRLPMNRAQRRAAARRK